MKYIQRVSQINRHHGILIVMLLASVLGLSKPAVADFNIWYHDDNFYNEYGDVTVGNIVMNPPAWACGVRFDNPSYYRWVDDYYNTLASDNFNKDVRVWLPIAGCPYSNSIVIEYTDGSETFEQMAGASHMEITTHYGRRWIDENGSWSACNNCTGPDSIAIENNDWGMMIAALANLTQAKGVYQHEYETLFSKADDALQALRNKIDAAIVVRGRKSLDDSGFDVSTLREHDAKLAFDETADLLAQCRKDVLSQSRVRPVFRSCHMAMDRITTTRQVLPQGSKDSR